MNSINRDKQIAELRAADIPQTEIAEKLNISQPTVSRALAKVETQMMLEREQEKFFECLPKARENIQDLIEGFKRETDSKTKELAWRSSMEALRAAGILPSQSMSYYFNTVINNQQNTILSPIIKEIIKAQISGNIIDITK